MELTRKRGQICPTRKVCEEEKDSHAFTTFCITRAECDKSSLLGENMRRDHNGQINLRAKQKFEILFATNISSGQTIQNNS